MKQKNKKNRKQQRLSHARGEAHFSTSRPSPARGTCRLPPHPPKQLGGGQGGADGHLNGQEPSRPPPRSQARHGAALQPRTPFLPPLVPLPAPQLVILAAAENTPEHHRG